MPGITCSEEGGSGGPQPRQDRGRSGGGGRGDPSAARHCRDDKSFSGLWGQLPWRQSGSGLLPSCSLVEQADDASPLPTPMWGQGLHLRQCPGPPRPPVTPSRVSPSILIPDPRDPRCHPHAMGQSLACPSPQVQLQRGCTTFFLLTQHREGDSGRPRGPWGLRASPSQCQQDEAHRPPRVRWGLSLPREVSSKTGGMKALGGTSSLCGLLLAFRHLQRPWSDSGRGDVPGKQDAAGEVRGRRNAEAKGGGIP